MFKSFEQCTCVRNTEICSKCVIDKKKCQCNKTCTSCKKVILNHQSQRSPTLEYCACILDYINSLRTKLILAHDLEIPTEEQTSVTELLDDRLTKHSLEPA